MKNTQLIGSYNAAALIDDQLFSLDIKADQLRQFLEQVVSVVNSHSNQLNGIQNDLIKKVYQEDIENQFTRISESVSLRDMEFLKTVSSQLEKPLAENSGDGLTDCANKIINKESVVSQGMGWLFKKIKDQENKFSQLDDDLSQRVKKEEMRLKVRKSRKKVRKEMEDSFKKLNQKLTSIDKQSNQSLLELQVYYQQNLSEIEKKTLWKIQDCETLLHKRINSDFVESSCQSVYDKILKEIEKIKDENFKSMHLDISELKIKVNSLQDNAFDKIKNIKQTVKEYTELLNNKYVTVEKLDITKNGINDRINEQVIKIQDLQRRLDAISNLEKQIPIIQEIEQRLHQFEHDFQLQAKDLEELNIKFRAYGEYTGGSGVGKSDIDPHKVCQLEADTKRLKVDQQDIENKLKQMDQENKRKLDHFEQRVISQLALLKTNNNDGSTSKDDIILTIERDIGNPNSLLRAKIIQLLSQSLNTGTNQSLEQTLRGILQNLGDLEKRTDGLMDLEKKVKKKFKQLTSNETLDFAKQLEKKANEADMRKEFEVVYEKIKSLSDLINILKQNYRSLEEFQEYIQTQLQQNTSETINMITGNNRIIAQRCVVCGTKSKQIKKQEDRSQDYGQVKYYRGDIKPTNVYETSEIYEINPNQITADLSKTVSQKQNVISYKDRPVSSKTDLSNANQSTFYSPHRNFRPQSASQKKQ